MIEKEILIDGKYRILKKIGEGGMSAVYLAEDIRLERLRAVKKAVKSGRSEEGYYELSIMAEANILKKLKSPYLPEIFDIVEEEGFLYIVMEYIEGVTLGEILKKDGAVSQETVIKWAIQLCSVLIYLHSQQPPIIYRDLKPENIMLRNDGRIKLIDFGIAREYKYENNNDTMCLGTKGYAAPEQFGRKGQTDNRTDIYCLGVTLYHLLTGKNPCEAPFRIYPIRYWNSGLSAGLETIINKCTQQNPEDRYQDAEKLMTALNNYEKEDIDFKNRIVKRLILCKILVVISALFFLTGCIFYCFGKDDIYRKYENLINCADKSTKKDEIFEYIKEATLIMPECEESYNLLIATIKEDGCMDREEEEVLIGIITPNLDIIHTSDDYGILAYEIGRLYWYYGEEPITAMKNSVPWFEDAVKYGTGDESKDRLADMYWLMGCFHRDVTVHVREGTEEGLFSNYYQNLENLFEYSKASDSERERLEAIRLVIYSLYNYENNFIRDGIEQSSIEELRTESFNCLEVIIPNNENDEALKNEIQQY